MNVLHVWAHAYMCGGAGQRSASSVFTQALSTVCWRQDPFTRLDLRQAGSADWPWSSRALPVSTSHLTIARFTSTCSAFCVSSEDANSSSPASVRHLLSTFCFSHIVIQLKLFYTCKFIFHLFSNLLKLVALLKVLQCYTTFQSGLVSYFLKTFYLGYLWTHKIIFFFLLWLGLAMVENFKLLPTFQNISILLIYRKCSFVQMLSF